MENHLARLYSVLRIEGDSEEIKERLKPHIAALLDLSPNVTRRGDYAFDLSRKPMWEAHERELITNLTRVNSALAQQLEGLGALYVDTALFLRDPPSRSPGEIPVVISRLHRDMIDLLSEFSIEFEFTIYLPRR